MWSHGEPENIEIWIGS